MSKRILKIIAVSLSLLNLCSCASIFSGGPKTLPIMSEPDEADCEVIDIRTGNTILKTKTPYTATLQPSAGFFKGAKYRIRLSKAGYLPQEQQIDSSINGWYFGNILFGGIIGLLIVDPATGAMWTINDENLKLKMYADNREGKMSFATDKLNEHKAMKMSDYAAVIADTTTAIKYYPEYAEAYCLRCATFAQIGENEKAMADAEKAIEVGPDYPGGYKERALLFMEKGQLEKALADLDKAVSIKADYADALYVRGKVNLKLNRIPEAKVDINSACKFGNGDACNYQF